ncbi:MAG: outer membrane beta-barrel protein [Bacteroidota bacterium]
MKKLLSVFVVALCLAGTASAQEGAMSVGGGLNLGLPMGDFGNIAGFGFGFQARFQYGLTNDLALAGSFGYISFSEKNSASSSVMPILASGRYYFTPGDGRPYGQADLGLTTFSQTFNFNFGGLGGFAGSASSTNFSIGFGGGYETKLNDKWSLDFGAGYNIILASGGSLSYIGIRAGANYAL